MTRGGFIKFIAGLPFLKFFPGHARLVRTWTDSSGENHLTQLNAANAPRYKEAGP